MHQQLHLNLRRIDETNKLLSDIKRQMNDFEPLFAPPPTILVLDTDPHKPRTTLELPSAPLSSYRLQDREQLELNEDSLPSSAKGRDDRRNRTMLTAVGRREFEFGRVHSSCQAENNQFLAPNSHQPQWEEAMSFLRRNQQLRRKIAQMHQDIEVNSQRQVSILRMCPDTSETTLLLTEIAEIQQQIALLRKRLSERAKDRTRNKLKERKWQQKQARTSSKRARGTDRTAEASRQQQDDDDEDGQGGMSREQYLRRILGLRRRARGLRWTVDKEIASRQK